MKRSAGREARRRFLIATKPKGSWISPLPSKLWLARTSAIRLKDHSDLTAPDTAALTFGCRVPSKEYQSDGKLVLDKLVLDTQIAHIP